MSIDASETVAILDKLNSFVNLNYDKDNVHLIYALAQIVHDRIQALDVTPEQKGAIMSHLLTNFIEFNKENLALHNEELKAFRESKVSTKH